MRFRFLACCIVMVCMALSIQHSEAQEYPVRPYVDANQLNVPWGWHSFYKQPWRAYMETRSGYNFLQGIGVNYNLPANDELAVRSIAQAGIKAVRFQIGWGSVNWNETAFIQDTAIRNILQLFKKYNLRPTILLNAYQGVPCPMQTLSRTITKSAPKNSRSITLDSVTGIVPKYTGLSNLTGYTAAEVFIIGINTATHVCQLSRPLPIAIAANKQVALNTLKYRPLYPSGNSNFNTTVGGWNKYALLVCSTLKSCGIVDFDLEVWNEITFGSAFLNINNYFSPGTVNFPKADFLHSGGHLWQLAAHTISAVKAKYPSVRMIWGFSNTTFFHTAIEDLPNSADGQSYHPYGVGTRSFPAQEQSPAMNVEGYTPSMDVRIPEGWAQEFHQTESLLRLINPADRLRHPKGTAHFYHYMTEHGVSPKECNITDPAKAWDLKTKVALRAYIFWLHKGMDMLGYYDAFDSSEIGFGLLPSTFLSKPVSVTFDQIATPPLRAIQNLTNAFAQSVAIANPNQLAVDVTALGDQSQIFAGDSSHPPLWSREVCTVLPFQVSANKYIVALYTMTFDITAPAEEASYRFAVTGCGQQPNDVQLYDPLTDTSIPIPVTSVNSDGATVELSISNTPRLLIITL